MSNGEVRVELRERRLSAILAADVVAYSGECKHVREVRKARVV